jgi:hypothetical protein
MIGFDLMIITPELYERALAEVKAGDADPIAEAIVRGMSLLVAKMHAAEVVCVTCGGDAPTMFEIAEAPAAVLIGVPDPTGLMPGELEPPGEPGEPPGGIIGGPICEACAALAAPQLRARIMAAMQRAFGGHERRLN